MKKVLKVLLWIGSLFGAWLGINLTGLAIFTPGFLSPSAGQGLSTRMFMEQLLAVSGGEGRLLAAGATCILISIACRKMLRQLSQSESDALAQKILVEVREGKPASQPYFLYLRAFETTRRLRAPLWLIDVGTLGLNRLWTSELEGVLSAAVRKDGPLIALGHPGENFGAGRVTTSDEAWMDDIAKLAGGARGILLIPSRRPGTVWEIEHLRKVALLNRAVFLMPPESRGFDWRSHWSEARRAIGTLGAALPEYEDVGMLFSLDENLQVRGIESFSAFSRFFLRKSIRRLLQQQGQLPSSGAALRKARRRSGRWRVFARANTVVRSAACLFFVAVAILGERAPRPEGGLPWTEFWHQFTNAAVIERADDPMFMKFVTSATYQELANNLTKDQELALRAEITHAGFRRLSDQELRGAYIAVSQMLARADVATCSADARSTLFGEALERAMLKVDSDQMDSWVNATEDATIAELEGKPIPAVSYGALVEARQQFEKSLKPEERSRYRELSAHGTARSAENECWLARKKYSAVGSLPEPHNLAWARLLEFEGERPMMYGLIKNPLEKLKALPAFQQRTQGMTEAQVADLFGELVEKGAARLDDSTLMARYAALGEVLAKADEAACEAIAQGKTSVEQFETALGQISDGGQAAFLNSQYRAAVAELQQVKFELLSKQDAGVAKKRFGEIVSTQEQVTAHVENCLIARKAFSAVTDLEEPYNRMWARVLSQQ
jgi:hypothetical protein